MPSSSVRLASSSTTSTRTGEPSSRWSRAAADVVFSLMTSVKPVVLCDDQHIPVRFLWTGCPQVPALRRVRHSARTGSDPTVAGMSNESTHPGPAEQPRSTLPQFDPDAPATPTVHDETQTL